LRDLPPAVLGDDSAQKESRVLIDLGNDVRAAMSEACNYERINIVYIWFNLSFASFFNSMVFLDQIEIDL